MGAYLPQNRVGNDQRRMEGFITIILNVINIETGIYSRGPSFSDIDTYKEERAVYEALGTVDGRPISRPV